MIAQSTFHGSPGPIVLNAVSDERAQLAVVHLDRNLNLHLPPGRNEMRPQALGQPKLIGRTLEILVGRFEWSHGDISGERGAGSMEQGAGSMEPDSGILISYSPLSGPCF